MEYVLIMFDAHCHSENPSDGNFEGLINYIESNSWGYATLAKHASVGLLSAEDPYAMEDLETYLKASQSIQIGEVSQEFLRPALALGSSYCRTVTIHAVKSTDKIISILEEFPFVRTIWHNYTGSIETARILKKLGCTPSLSPRIWKAKTSQHIDELWRLGAVLESDMYLEDPSYNDVWNDHCSRFASVLEIRPETLENELAKRCALIAP